LEQLAGFARVLAHKVDVAQAMNSTEGVRP
jgi:hypothetical protein